MKIGLYCDNEDWALGYLALQIKRVHGNGGGLTFLVTSWKRFMESPVSQVRALRRCGIIHWLTAHGYFEYGSLFPKIRQICTIHHILPGDNLYPQRFQGVRVLTVSRLSQRALDQRGFPASVIDPRGPPPRPTAMM